MSPSEDWRGRDIAVQIERAAAESRRAFGDKVVPGDCLGDLQQASNELKALFPRIQLFAERQGKFDFRREAPLFASFFTTLAMLQRSLVDLDLYALRTLCQEPGQTREIKLLSLAIKQGRRDEAQGRLNAIGEWCPVDELPATTTHLLATVRDEWYELDHKPLEIGTFLEITSVGHLLEFLDDMKKCHDVISQFRSRLKSPRPPRDYR